MPRKQRRRAEEELQKATAKLFKRLGWFAWHTPNEEMDKVQRILAAKRGVMAGVPDWIVAEPWEHRGRRGNMMAIELKSPTGTKTAAQKAFFARAEQRGWLVGTCRTMDDVTDMCRLVEPRNGRRIA